MKTALFASVVVGTLLRAQPSPADAPARERPDWGRVRDSLEIRRAELEVVLADLRVETTDIWHRLIPRITATASFGVGGLAFIDVSEPTAPLLPTDSYRLTLSLSLSDLITNTEHEKAHLMKEQAHLARGLAQTEQLMNEQVAAERSARLGVELALLEEELRLTERIMRYYALLFEQGKASFDVALRAELRALEVRQKLERLRSELAGPPAH